MDPRRWWLLVGLLPAPIACAIAAGTPALRPLGDLAVAAAGLITAAVLWFGGRRTDHRTGWRLLAVAPLFPVLGAILAAVVAPTDPLELVVLRWVPTVPGYVLAITAILTLVDPARLRAGGLRLGVELALFGAASLVVVELLVLGPGGRWADLTAAELVILGAAVLATSATLAAALTLLGVIEADRRSMALVLLLGMAVLVAGRGLATSALLANAPLVVDTSRFLVVGGLWLLVTAVLLDARRASGADAAAHRSAELGHLLPHLAMLAAVAVVGGFAVTGSPPSRVALVGIVVSVGLAAVHRWVTARDERRMAGLLRRGEAYFRSLVRSSGDAVVILDDDLRIGWTSTALERALGPVAAELAGRRLLDVVHPGDAAGLAAALPVTAPEAPACSGLLLLRLRDAEGVWRFLEAGISDLRRDPDVGAVVLHCRDMTDRHARELALQDVAYTDPLTGLPNRARFLAALAEAAEAAAERPAALLLVELDGVEDARRSAGQGAVTEVVAETGRRLRGTVRGEDVVARLGGGAFAVLATGSPEDADRLASRCLSTIERPVVVPTGVVDLTAGVGLVHLGADDRDRDGEELLARADLAVRAAHAAGSGSAARYTEALGEDAARQDRLRTDLPGAADRGELGLLFQPIVSLESQRATGLDAALGWRHPLLGDVAPSEFLPLAERTGVIGELMRWALGEAAAAAAGLCAGEEPLRVGLKVPAGYVATGTMIPDVEQALQRAGLPPERLVLQIGADTMQSDDVRIALDVSSLRLMGVHVTLHGFGGGTSALAHLTALPIDTVRLDRSFITRLDRDPQSRALCESVVGIAKRLGLSVVGDGVETPAQLAALCGFGADFAQGFLIARPMPLPDLRKLLAESAGALWPGLVASG